MSQFMKNYQRSTPSGVCNRCPELDLLRILDEYSTNEDASKRVIAEAGMTSLQLDPCETGPVIWLVPEEEGFSVLKQCGNIAMVDVKVDLCAAQPFLPE